MKIVTAIIKPFKIEQVTDALRALDVSGITLSEVRGHGRQRGHTEVYRGAEYEVAYLPKVRLEVVVDDADVERVANTIMDSGAYRQDRRRQALDPVHRDAHADPNGRSRSGRALHPNARGTAPRHVVAGQCLRARLLGAR